MPVDGQDEADERDANRNETDTGNGIERLFTGAFVCSLDSSIHLLANDTGCVWRHSYDPETGAVSPFRSGYVNRSCEPEGR
jgi:hypothetical protein